MTKSHHNLSNIGYCDLAEINIHHKMAEMDFCLTYYSGTESSIFFHIFPKISETLKANVSGTETSINNQ